MHDAFAGTASVSRALRGKGWRVHSSDLLMSSYVFQRAYVVAEAADLLYHVLVLLRVRGLPLERVIGELRARHAAKP